MHSRLIRRRFYFHFYISPLQGLPEISKSLHTGLHPMFRYIIALSGLTLFEYKAPKGRYMLPMGEAHRKIILATRKKQHIDSAG